MIKKSTSKWFPLATTPILGQPSSKSLANSASDSTNKLTTQMANFSMKLNSVIIAAGILALILSGHASASDAEHTSEAMEHAGEAVAHGDDGHAKELLKHAKESLTHAKAAEGEHAEAHKHMTEAIKHLEDAIIHAEAGHADAATRHTKEAMDHMHKSAH